MTDQQKWTEIEKMIRSQKRQVHDNKRMTGVTYVRLTQQNWCRFKADTIIIGVIGNYIKICKLKRS